MALQERLPYRLPHGQVRSALTAVIARTLEASDTFDTNKKIYKTKEGQRIKAAPLFIE